MRSFPLSLVLLPLLAASAGCSISPAGDAASRDAGTTDATATSDAGQALNDGGGSADGSLACNDGAPPWTDPGIAPPTVDPTLTGAVHHFFKITVVDANGATPLAGATLMTTNQTVYTTDDDGVVAYYEPGLMDTDVYFSPSRAGYTFAADAYGNAGVALHPTEGGSGVVQMTKMSTVAVAAQGTLQSRLAAGTVPDATTCFAIRAVDSITGRGVPLVDFVTDAGDSYWCDSQGMVAYCDPDELGQSVHFTVTSHGYSLANATGMTIATTAGGSTIVSMVRADVAERLYRVTGEGIYRDSILLGLTTPVAHPTINGLVMGQDTPSTNVYEGKLYGIWQDTERPAYPLGNFDSSGATALLPDAGGLSPDLGIDTTYFVGSDGFSRGMVTTTEGGGPIWLGQLVNVTDTNGATKMYGRYYVARSSNPSTALTVFDDATSTFDYVADYPAMTLPGGRPSIVNTTNGAYAYWSNPIRFPATVAGITDFAGYEAFTPYHAAGSTTLDTNADGSLAYSWKAGASPATAAVLASANVDASQVLDGHLTDVLTGDTVQVANESTIWNPYRDRFDAIVQQQYGTTSFLGESWLAEADTPLGPWVFARKVVTHTGYTFYNPDLIPYFSEAGGRILFFDATYTATYTNLTPTPRYNYNEIMYRADLDDPRLVLPVPVYDVATSTPGDFMTKRGIRPGDIARSAAFFAYDRPAPGAVPIAWSGPSCGARRLQASGNPTAPLFYALPATTSVDGGAGPATVPLYEYAGPNGAYAYSTNATLSLAGYTLGAAIAEVWPSPIAVSLPISDFLGDLVADAGVDQCVSAPTSPSGASVVLDASKSRDLAGAITSYTWSDAADGCALATGVMPTVVLGAGLHTIRLDTLDAAGNASSDTVTVAVAPST